MAQEGITSESAAGEGQATSETLGEGTTGGASVAGEGTTEGATAGTTGSGTHAKSSDETFIDPTDLPSELQGAYKNMQRAFTKKMQGIKDQKQKIEAFDAFNADPVGQLQRIAKQMGYNLSRADAQQAIQQQAGNTQQGDAWEPQSWDEVLQKAEQRAYDRIMQEQQPLLNEVQSLRKSNLETFLDSNAPDWRVYEDDMMANLQKHPSLVNDPLSLYRLSVPSDVLESRATQKALKKLEEKGQSAKIGGGSQTTRLAQDGLPNKSLSFDDAVKAAKQDLARRGIKGPG